MKVYFEIKYNLDEMEKYYNEDEYDNYVNKFGRFRYC